MARPSTHIWPVAALIAAILHVPSALGSDISGQVLGDNGQPLAGATVLVSTAAPRVGVAIYCPSCYADCGKQVLSDADGNFTIGSLDPGLVFYLTATAEGYRAGKSGKVDPSGDKPTLKLKPLPQHLEPDHVVRGRVLDSAGKPVVGAAVTPFGCKTARERYWGNVRGVDAVSITNDRGEFILTSTEPAEGYDLEVRSPRHAAKRYPLVETGDDAHDLVVEPGSVVRGRLVKHGQGVRDVLVGLVQTDRSSEAFLGEYQIGTNANGEFEFSYIPAHDDMYIYTKMTSMHGDGALPLRRVTIGDNDKAVELGDLSLAASHTLAGRIELTDGAPVPGPLQLLASREGAWDSQIAMVQSDGAFRFEDEPDSEPLTFTARVPGYHLASGRNRFQQLRDNSIAMFVEGPRDDIVIYFEPERAEPKSP